MATLHVNHLVMEAKDHLVESIRGTVDVPAALANAVTMTVVQTLKDTRGIGPATSGLIADCVKGCVRGAAEVGVDAGRAAQPIMIGTVRGMKLIGAAGTEFVSAAAEGLVRSAAESAGNVPATTRGAVQGAVACAREIGVSAETAASAAASGAAQAAEWSGAVASRQVREVLAEGVSGVKVLIAEPNRLMKPRRYIR
ncbi:MAG TPA: hypothetical protein VLT84_07760 [Acidobacteriota bacterium]|nr:hypothetical protein [Acidobacteriota bacterium]